MAQKGNSLTQIALQKFKKDFWGVFSLAYLALCFVIAVFAYLIIPDDSENANQMQLAIHSKSPGFTVKMLTLDSKELPETTFSEYFFGKKNVVEQIPISDYKIENNELVVEPYVGENEVGMSKIFTLSENFEGYKNWQEVEEKLIEEKTFLLGTDKFGRDMLSRMLVGMRISISIGFVAVFISLLIGMTLGAIAGYFGGKIDQLIMWLINVTWSIPTLLLVIAITLALGKGFWQVFIAVGLTMWVEVARVVRGQVMSVKKMQYVTAARTLGYTDFRIIKTHILPNILAPVIVISAANFAAAILIESGLSFLGIGAQPPMPSWGSIIKDHYNYIILGKPYLAIIPGLAIMSLVMTFMLIGNAIRDAFDVRI
ncbi:ABC transporter permease [Mesonia sp. K7]|uniref:ABC transporter permease n=1 Tax=Mesonia sp. K7 TaxID=2218606 RepID=UPI000DA826EB|nr:ABC transporter permease [Mesonia sp. K7]PZD77762.1 ABC transporter permease [Mesonia sp. K7]